MENDLIEALILLALKNNPDGLTTKQITKIVRTKLKLIKKYKQIQEKEKNFLQEILK